MSIESAKNSVVRNLNPVDFAESLYDTAVQQPVNAVRQLAGEHVQPSDSSKSDTLAGKAGNIAGFVVDFAVLNKVTGGLINPMLGEAATGIAGSSAKMAIAGGLYGGLLTPSSPEKGLLQGRLENAAVNASTFAIMGGVTRGVEGTAFFKEKTLLKTMGSNAIAGGAGGISDAFTSTYFSQHRLATADEVLDHAAQYAAFGAGFAALNFGASKGIEKALTVPKISDAYYGTQWKIDEAKIDAKRQYYATLNKFDMRHPLQKLGDFFYNTDVASDAPRPALTEANNPVTQFQKELPEFYKQIRAKESLQEETTDRKQAYELHKEMGEIRTNFAAKLLAFWHGTADQPGIKQFTDAELATPKISQEQVAQIRHALTLNAKPKFPNASALDQALADISEFDEIGEQDNYALANDIGRAKEKFYNYDESELSKRMSMPREHAYMDHDYSTPLTWMPYEPNSQLPNLFHGSVSNSLPSILNEGKMLPAKELRLRGIEQKTGESADEEFPRRSISVTRDFNEAWAYSRHSPEYLTGHPIVFGISQDVIPRAHSAGMLEPGEILIDRLKMGSSWLSNLGPRPREVTHVYVPDREVSTITNQIAARRVKGLQVVGLSELQSPHWLPPQLPVDEY